MGSENRQRTAFLAIRLDPSEEQWIAEQAGEAGVTKSELARALIFGREPARPVAGCNSAHVGCTRSHIDMVESYRDQRYREEQEYEDATGNTYGSSYALRSGEHTMWRENGGRLTTFRDWLEANKTAGRD